ncbi:DUF3278 domain-containing protein [Bacillus manliponensis]|uniref:DUF3278 domain-containing protein n=1 Tax=Bacillus manliponensis TaxID=574376 RepID=UPI0035185418
MKKHWKENIYNNFIGAMTDRDEYQKQEINKELAISGIMLWWLNMVAMLIMLILDTINHTISAGTIIILIINLLYAAYFIWKTKSKSLTDTECATEEEYIEKKKQLQISSVKVGLFWGFWMFILNSYLFPYIGSEKLSVSLSDVIRWSLGGVFFGAIMYRVGLSNLKKLY